MDKIYINELKALREQLDPMDEQWSGWYFRGQPDSEFELVPSIWRNIYAQHFKKFSQQFGTSKFDKQLEELSQKKQYHFTAKIRENIIECHSYRKFENYILAKFYEIASKTELKVQELIRRRLSTRGSNYWKNDINVENFFALIELYIHNKKKLTEDLRINSGDVFDAALPQHHGVPTRILDWTTNPRKALFFAAYYYLKNKHKCKEISIYAFHEKNDVKNQSKNPILFSKSHDRSNNRFLHHQSGVFSYIFGEFFYFDHGHWPSIEKLSTQTRATYYELKKYTIDASMVPKILNMLEQSEICMASLMPDYTHVAEQVLFQLENDI